MFKIMMFKTLEESIELYKQSKKEDSGFWYVWNCEETELTSFDVNGDADTQLQSLYADNADIDVDNGRDIFAEFTAKICPAYKDL